MSARRCTARSKRTGERCGANAILGRETCRHHGGLTPRGAASAGFKHGRYSRDIPTRLEARYGVAAHDPELLRLLDEVALCEARAAELLGMLGDGGGAGAWAAVGEALAAYRQALDAGDDDGQGAAFESLAAAVEAGSGEGTVWAELWEVLDRGARYKAAERKLAVAEAGAIQVDEALTLIGALVSIVRQHVRDPEALAAISRDTERLLHKGGDGGEN
jgi:hypothetical protein